MGIKRSEFYSPDFDFLELITPEYKNKITDNYKRHSRGEDIPPYEYVMVTRDGKRLDLLNSSKLIKYGGKTAILGIVTDITRRKRIERLLRTFNSATLEAQSVLAPQEIFISVGKSLKKIGIETAVFLLDGENDRLGVAYHSYDSKVTGVAEKLLGLKAEDFSIVLGKVEIFQRVCTGRETILVEGANLMEQVLPEPCKGYSGRLIELLKIPKSAIAPLIVEDEVVGLLAVQSEELIEEDIPAVTAFAHQMVAAWRKSRLMQDLEHSLSELKRTQEQLVQSQKMEAIGNLAGGIAHDFNNILTAITGYTDLVRDKISSDGTPDSDLDAIRRAVDRAASLTRQLLAFSRKQVLQPKVLDLNAVVEGMQKLLRRLIPENIDLTTELSPDLDTVKADPGQIEQVIMNLVVNARDAMPAGGSLIVSTGNTELNEEYAHSHLEVSPGPYVVLSVRDTGIGMDEDTMRHLFEPFFTTKEQGKGTGLGLSTVYGIVKQSSGHIDVESEPGKGTSFRIFLPRIGEEAEVFEPDRSDGQDLVGTETVLLVEDERVVRDLVHRILRRLGYTVFSARNADEAVRISGSLGEPIHLLITDIIMPGSTNGWDLAERLRSSRPGMVVLFISGYSDHPIKKYDQQDSAFLQKPFTPDSLSMKVRDLLNAART
jgi:signal transduction histidine kinase